MSLKNGPHRRRFATGVSMLEVLIALLLLTATLLGATALQITGLHTNRSAYYRTQASILAYDIADRIRLNRAQALASPASYTIDTDSGTVPSGSTCISTLNGCSAASLADVDTRQWSEHFFDVTSVGADGSAWAPLLPGGRGQVSVSGSNVTVTVSWAETDWNIGSDSNKSSRTKSFSMDFTIAE